MLSLGWAIRTRYFRSVGQSWCLERYIMVLKTRPSVADGPISKSQSCNITGTPASDNPLSLQYHRLGSSMDISQNRILALRLSLVVIANLLLAIGLLGFSVGLMRPPPLLPSLSSSAYHQHDTLHSHPPAKFDKLIFMVIDALRRLFSRYIRQKRAIRLTATFSDFVYSPKSGFRFTRR